MEIVMIEKAKVSIITTSFDKCRANWSLPFTLEFVVDTQKFTKHFKTKELRKEFIDTYLL